MSNVSLMVDSTRFMGTYKISRFTEYRVDIDLETDSDGFDFVFKNPDGIFTGLVSKFDKVDIHINDRPVMRGEVDRVKYIWNESDNLIHVTGRDMAHILVDNDSIPGTKLNVKPSSYISSKCAEYGIKCVAGDNAPAIDKLIIGTGESEISIMNNILMDSRKRIWYVYDTLYTGDWNTNAKPSYTFTRGDGGIPIKSLSLDDDGTDTKSEVRIYGSMNSGAEKVVGVAKNDWLLERGIIRRMTKRSSNNDSSSKYASNALKDIREGFRDNIELEITTKTPDTIILPNKTARVTDEITKINSTFFITRVSYSKTLNSGSETVVRMIPGDTTFDVAWSGVNNGSVVGTSKMSLQEVLSKYGK